MKRISSLCAAVSVFVAAAALDFVQAGVVEWEFPRTGDCHEGLPFSDGVTGVLVWGGGDTINVTVGRADLWDHRGGYPWLPSQSYTNIATLAAKHDEAALKKLFPNPAKPGEPRNPYMLPLGRVVVKVPGRTLARGTLDPFTGRGTLEFAEGGKVEIAMSRKSRTFAMRFPVGVKYEVKSVPATDHEPFFTKELKRYGFEKAVAFDGAIADGGGFSWRLPADKSVWLSWEAKNGELALTTGRGDFIVGKEGLTQFASFGEVAIAAAAQWAAFWKEGARVKVPDPLVQRLYDYGMYRFGAMTDPEGIPAGLQGAWLEDDELVPWNGDYHFNINVQECYAPAYRGGHFANLMPLFRMILSWRPLLRSNAKTFVGIDDGYVLPHSVDDRGVCIGGFWSGTIDHGSTAWMASMMFRYVKYSGDVAFLKGSAYDFMKGAMNVYIAMTEERDGKLSLPLCASPEWVWVGRDSSFQLAAAHRLARDLVDAAAKLGEKPDPRWLDLMKRLPRYNRTKTGGIDIYEGQSLTESHRHHSHLAGFYPFDILDLSDKQTRFDAYEAMGHWVSMGTGSWSGWCVPWASILHTHFGEAHAAVAKLHDWDTFFSGPGHASHHDAIRRGYTTMMGRDHIMQMDGQCAEAVAVLEMLAHEVNGQVGFFMGCPDEWKDVSFENLALSDGRRANGRRVNGRIEINYMEGTGTK